MNNSIDCTTDNATLILYRSQLIGGKQDTDKQDTLSKKQPGDTPNTDEKSNFWYPSKLKEDVKKKKQSNRAKDQQGDIDANNWTKHRDIYEKDDEFSPGDHASINAYYTSKKQSETPIIDMLKDIFRRDAVLSEKISIHGVYRSEIVYILNQSLLKLNIEGDNSFPCKFLIIDSDNLSNFTQFLKSLKLNEDFIANIVQFKIHILVLAERDLKSPDISALEDQAVVDTLLKAAKDLKKNTAKFGILTEYTDKFNSISEIYSYFKISNVYKIIGYLYCGRYRLKRKEELLSTNPQDYRYYNDKINLFGVDDNLSFIYNEIFKIENNNVKNLSSHFVYKIFKKFNKNANNIIKLRKISSKLQPMVTDYINIFHSRELVGSKKLQKVEEEFFTHNREIDDDSVNLIKELGIGYVNVDLDNYSKATDLLDNKLLKENMINCMKYGFDTVEKRVKKGAKLFLIGSNSAKTEMRSLMLSSVIFNYEPLNFLASKEQIKEYIERQINLKQSIDIKYQFIKLFTYFNAFEHAFALACILALCKHGIPIVLTDVAALTSAVFAFNLINKSSFYMFINEKVLNDPLSNYLTNKLNLRPVVNSYDQLNKISSSYLSILLFSKIDI